MNELKKLNLFTILKFNTILLINSFFHKKKLK